MTRQATPSPRLVPVLGLILGLVLLAYGVRPVVVTLTLLPLAGRGNEAYLLGQIAVPTLALAAGILLIVVSLKKLRQPAS